MIPLPFQHAQVICQLHTQNISQSNSLPPLAVVISAVHTPSLRTTVKSPQQVSLRLVSCH